MGFSLKSDGLAQPHQKEKLTHQMPPHFLSFPTHHLVIFVSAHPKTEFLLQGQPTFRRSLKTKQADNRTPGLSDAKSFLIVRRCSNPGHAASRRMRIMLKWL